MLEQMTGVQIKNVLHWSDCICSSKGAPAVAALLEGDIIFLAETDTLAPELSRANLKSTSTDSRIKIFPPPSAESCMVRHQHLFHAN